jgi:hypothetical protein
MYFKVERLNGIEILGSVHPLRVVPVRNPVALADKCVVENIPGDYVLHQLFPAVEIRSRLAGVKSTVTLVRRAVSNRSVDEVSSMSVA